MNWIRFRQTVTNFVWCPKWYNGTENIHLDRDCFTMTSIPLYKVYEHFSNTTICCDLPVRVPQQTRDINPFNPEFTIVIFIHYKLRIVVAILDL